MGGWGLLPDPLPYSRTPQANAIYSSIARTYFITANKHTVSLIGSVLCAAPLLILYIYIARAARLNHIPALYSYRAVRIQQDTINKIPTGFNFCAVFLFKAAPKLLIAGEDGYHI